MGNFLNRILDDVIRSDGICPKCGSYLKSRISGDFIWFYCSNPLCDFREAFRKPVKWRDSDERKKEECF